MVTMHILTYAVLNYIHNLPVLFAIRSIKSFDDDICLHTRCQTLFIVWAIKKAVRIQQFTDGTTIVLRNNTIQD